MACHQLTEEDIIEVLRSTGGAKAAAAHLLGISPRTLQRRLDNMPPVCLERPLSAEQLMNAEVRFKILQMALGGNLRCCIWWLTRIGWGRDLVTPVLWSGPLPNDVSGHGTF